MFSFLLLSKRRLSPVDSSSSLSSEICSCLYIPGASTFLSFPNATYSSRVMGHLVVIPHCPRSPAPSWWLCSLLHEGQTPWHTSQSSLYIFPCLPHGPIFLLLLFSHKPWNPHLRNYLLAESPRDNNYYWRISVFCDFSGILNWTWLETHITSA